ncbi:hypothetical protein PRIPAC_92879 [Pristionchus pacificus]|uniref:SWIB domain-containing protein n=1 Tax=Pristionchus pacificus TaxID=54126 RepID=A0A2A6BJ58_PRIPA|nr:hypothetical protein PRIPAC_92879 [Pristionchus pacificus]|eukprot:PDM65932.1 hypothetical protein PRIPAC_44211 [Pristionchus pacificus]
MSSSEDEVRLPVAESEVRREVSSVIARDGVDNLKSKAVREHLKNTFNVDFSSYKSQVDDVIKSCIIALNTKKPETPPKKEVQQEKSDSDSDSDSDPGVASPDRMPVPKKRKVSSTKSTPVVKKEEEEMDSPENEDLHSAVKRRRRAATKTTVERKFTKREPGATKRPSTKLGKFSKAQFCSDELMALTGQRYMLRSDVVKAIWAYIKTNNCADPKNRQFAICDDILKPIFKKNRFKSFGMMKIISEQRHLMKPEEISQECVEEAREYEKIVLAERNAARLAENGNYEGEVKKEDEVKEEEDEEDGADEDDGEDSD